MLNATKAQLKSVQGLKDRSTRYEHRLFLIEGKKVLEEAVRAGLQVQEVYCTSQFAESETTYLHSLSLTPFIAELSQLEQLAATSTFPGILGVVNMPRPVEEAKGNLIACLAGVNDPGNLGTMIRTAEWFGVSTLILGPGTVDPYNEKVVRSAMGSLFRMNLQQSDDLAQFLTSLKKQGYLLMTAETRGGKELSDRITQPICLVMGSESHGLPAELSALADYQVTIPGFGLTESLNVGVSFGIILYQLKLLQA